MNPTAFPGEPCGGPAINDCDWGELVGKDDWQPCGQPATIVVYVPEIEIPEECGGGVCEPFWIGYCPKHYAEWHPVLNSPTPPPDDCPF